jgi:hypothetical protein
MGLLCENIRRGKRRLEASEILTATESEVPLTVTSLSVLIGVSPGHLTSHVVYPLTNQSTTPCIYPASGTHP